MDGLRVLPPAKRFLKKIKYKQLNQLYKDAKDTILKIHPSEKISLVIWKVEKS